MLPLKNTTILITRAESQSEDFSKKLQRLGANTISIPLIKTAPINKTELSSSYNNTFDWLIFTSVNAAIYFFETIDSKTVQSKIAVVGEKTAQYIQHLGLMVNFQPSEYTGKHLANEIPINTNEKIFIPRSIVAKNDLVEILENRNCKVTSLSIYDNTPIAYSIEELTNLLNCKIDYITFTSGSTVKAFANLNYPLNHTKAICIGPETAKIAQQLNITIAEMANPHTIEGMIDAILLANKKSLTE
jgi:uroporphyrinogen-III synthase